MNQRDREIVRDWAKRYMELALSEEQGKMNRRMKDTNDLKITRPPVLIDEIPWHEMNFEGALDCVCEDTALRNMEYTLRVALYREKYFKCDNYIEPVWPVYKAFENTGNGFAIKEQRLAVDQKNNIVSHHYEDVLEDESALEMYHDPVITPHPELDAANVAQAEEILDGIMPVQLRGHGIYYSPWDQISMLRGVEPILFDIYDRPEYLHKLMELFTRGMSLTMDQMEKYGLYDPRVLSLHCTPGTVTPPTEPDPAQYGCKDIWFRTMAQMFNMVSPEVHDEFDIQYSIPLASRCAYTYYGCCEPLHDRIDKLQQYPNLRKIGVTPWAKEEVMAERMGGKYVYSKKPSPAHVAIATDPEVIRKETEATVRLCQKYGCPAEFVLKDISTVSHRPQNLIVWANTVSDVLDQYYGE